jgi:hypothetical protein
VVDWAAAVLIDSDCEETLQTIQFANLQLLRYRYLDDLLDTELANSAKWARWPTPFSRLLGEGPNQRVRELGASIAFEQLTPGTQVTIFWSASLTKA